MSYQTDVVIIGAGPVGLFTIFQCGMVGLKVHVFDGLPHVGGQCSALYPDKPIYDIPAHPHILGQDLISSLAAQADVFNPVFHLQHKIVKVESTHKDDFLWRVESSGGVVIETKAIIIAAGVGAFGPNKPPLEHIETFEKKSIRYFIPDKEEFRDKKIVIAGGGDSAVDWAIALQSIAKKVTIVHRRNRFRATPSSEEKLNQLFAEHKIDLATPYQLYKLNGFEDKLHSVQIQNFDDQSVKDIEADYLLPFFGLSTNLGPIADWGLGLTKKSIDIDPLTGATNKKGIYAVGDIASYPHKLKLILTGFSESAQAAHAIYRQTHENQPLHFEHSSTKEIFQK
jgi:thioredoxin reductase (NADPH)